MPQKASYLHSQPFLLIFFTTCWQLLNNQLFLIVLAILHHMQVATHQSTLSSETERKSTFIMSTYFPWTNIHNSHLVESYSSIIMVATTPKISVTVHEHCPIAPPAGDDEVAELTLPLSYFDVSWVNFPPASCLLFYRFPCSSVHFLETVVPNLKKSLSQTLKHYLTLVGNLLIPLNLDMPEFRYVMGDTLCFTIAETNGDFDFDYWTGNEARDAAQFHAFVPDLPEPKIDSDAGYKIIPLQSVQVTLFPGIGICFGFASDHAGLDARSFVMFVKCWSSLTKLGKEDGDNHEFLAKNGLLPLFDRSVITDPSRERAAIFWNQMKQKPRILKKLPDNSVRQTFELQKSDLQKLRNTALAKRPQLIHLSSFTILSAYIWSCHVKSAIKIGEEVDENEPEYYVIAMDGRHRLDPPVPAEYFGNCITPAIVRSTHGQLKGDDGFCTAVELIGETISKHNNTDEFMKSNADDWLGKIKQVFRFQRSLTLAGSPKFDLYDTDFGWGTPNKYEVISIDGDNSLSLCKSRKFEGGLEIGLSLPKPKVDAFATFFVEGLKI